MTPPNTIAMQELTPQEIKEKEQLHMTSTAITLVNRIKIGNTLSNYVIVDVKNKVVFSIFFSELLRRAGLRFEKQETSFDVGKVTVILYNKNDEFPDVNAVVFFA